MALSNILSRSKKEDFSFFSLYFWLRDSNLPLKYDAYRQERNDNFKKPCRGIFHLSDNKTVPLISVIEVFHLYAIKAYPIVHYLEHCGYVLQLRSQAQPYNIVTVLHDLHAGAFKIGMRDASIYRVAFACRQLLVSKKAGDEDADIIRKLLL